VARRGTRTVVAVLAWCLVLAVPALAQATGEAVRGVIREGDEVLDGVEISVETADGEQIGTVVTDEDGRYELELPGPGDYVATLDTDTLPEGTSLRFDEGDTLEFRISPGQSRPLLFPLGEGDREVGGQARQALQLLVEGVKFGLIIAMSAVGLSLIFGTTGLVNFAHGELVTFGALATWYVNVGLGVALIPAAVVGILAGGAAGGLLDRGLWRPLRRRGTGLIAMLVVSIGLSLLLRFLFLYQFGGRTRPFDQYAVQRAVDVGPVNITPRDLFSIVLSVVVLTTVGLLLQRTRIGRAMRAVADNPDLASSSGIDVQRVVLLVWVFGAGLAALGGVLFGLGEQVSFQMGFQLLLLMFAGVILGGLGTAYGALVGSFLVGIFVQMSTLVISSELKNVGALVILALILLVRPQGILGQPARVG
jgi:neutral amino acid transport system permease protein